MRPHAIVAVLFSAALLLSASAADDESRDIVAEYLVEYQSLTLNRPLLTTAAGKYDDQFWERFIRSDDRELKLAFVLSYISATLESELDHLERGEVRFAKEKRKLTKEERGRAIDSAERHLRDLALLDPADSFQACTDLRARLRRIEGKEKK